MHRRFISHPHRRFWKTAVALVGLLLLGAAGFWLLEDMEVLDALYMAVITLSTVGIGEVRPCHRVASSSPSCSFWEPAGWPCTC